MFTSQAILGKRSTEPVKVIETQASVGKTFLFTSVSPTSPNANLQTVDRYKTWRWQMNENPVQSNGVMWANWNVIINFIYVYIRIIIIIILRRHVWRYNRCRIRERDTYSVYTMRQNPRTHCNICRRIFDSLLNYDIIVLIELHILPLLSFSV